MLYRIHVDTKAIAPGGENWGLPPIIVRRYEETAEGPKHLGRDRCWSVDIPGPSSVVSNLDGSQPHVWVETRTKPILRSQAP